MAQMLKSHMDHGDHLGKETPAMCSMNMLFTWDTTNLCIVFRQWHIRSTAGLIFSLAAVILITAGYEGIREASRRYEAWAIRQEDDLPRRNQAEVSKRAHLVRSVLYAVQTFYAFMIMLVFMTYNGWVMLSVAVGAFLGFLVFGGKTASSKETACH